MEWHDAFNQRSDPYKTLHNPYYSDLENNRLIICDNRQSLIYHSSAHSCDQSSGCFLNLVFIPIVEAKFKVSNKSLMPTEGDDDKMQE